jgi:YggT family protein
VITSTLVYNLIARLINVFEFIILVRVVLSFIQLNPYNPIVSFIYRITDPPLNTIRHYIPWVVVGMLDLSPLVLIFLLRILLLALHTLVFKILVF